ncbi:DNA repair protein RecN (Recombination protein N) [Alkalispirochaeta americana]|uniref:DNA repair protein RecN n=1 Tax=Alkalispirochaeta americana TaxID=159291 RepID=A0A1N6PJG7_9SPIO|nr:DNA repair protein RecN [Alkalispirochaeta americana]SIQ04427.1 DNA repair protein RecN (Recombination protein N) [Alkalispirochaeta americana]
MIERITVRNFILVEHLELDFTPGFTVLTGETGAGKSILVGALSLLFGGKGGADLVRAGAQEAMVAGEFNVAGHTECASWLSSRDIAPDEGVVLIRRTVKTSGRGTIYMQDVPVTRSDLEEFAGFLLDLHSQHEHQSLFHESSHRRLVDRYAGIEADVARYGEDFSRLGDVQQQLQRLREREKDRQREIEMLEFSLQEIESAGIRPGEWDDLEIERAKLVQYEKLATHIEAVCHLTDSSLAGTPSLVEQLKTARIELAAAARIDPSLEGEASRLENSYYEMEDLLQSVTGYRDQMVYDPARLDVIEERLGLLRGLFRKYGETEEQVLRYAEEARVSLAEIEKAGESREKLTHDILLLEQRLGQEARRLSSLRSEAGQGLQKQIREVLAELAMGRAEFIVSVQIRTGESGRLICGPHGADRIRFLISTNIGEEPRPLSQVASGGELSRIMLAIKTVLAGSDDLRTLVFDEIDTGIGGQVALALAAHLRSLADHTQVICITHLATIAVRADNHIAVEKHVEGDRTIISARKLADQDCVQEIARMLSGDGQETHSVEHARALLDRYRGDAHGKD